MLSGGFLVVSSHAGVDKYSLKRLMKMPQNSRAWRTALAPRYSAPQIVACLAKLQSVSSTWLAQRTPSPCAVAQTPPSRGESDLDSPGLCSFFRYHRTVRPVVQRLTVALYTFYGLLVV